MAIDDWRAYTSWLPPSGGRSRRRPKSLFVNRFGGLLVGDSSTRQRQVNRLLPAQPGRQPCDAAFLFELRPQRRRRAAGPRGELFNLLIDIFGGNRNVFPPGNLIQDQGTGDGCPG